MGRLIRGRPAAARPPPGTCAGLWHARTDGSTRKHVTRGRVFRSAQDRGLPELHNDQIQ